MQTTNLVRTVNDISYLLTYTQSGKVGFRFKCAATVLQFIQTYIHAYIHILFAQNDMTYKNSACE